MKKNIVILGAGFGELELSSLVSGGLDPRRRAVARLGSGWTRPNELINQSPINQSTDQPIGTQRLAAGRRVRAF